MTLQTKLEPFGEALADIVENTFHYWRPVGAVPCLIWAEDGENGLEADNIKEGQAIQGTIHYFTKTEYDPAVDSIQAALNDFGAAWFLSDVQYEEETNLIHHTWIWEVV